MDSKVPFSFATFESFWGVKAVEFLQKRGSCFDDFVQSCAIIFGAYDAEGLDEMKESEDTAAQL